MAMAVLSAAIAAPAAADRREYKVTVNGARLIGSEVCFYASTSHKDPFSLFFSYDEVGCLPADEILDFPAGTFHAFARNVLAGMVSAHRDYFIYDSTARPERGYEELEVPLTRAAFVDFTDLRATLTSNQSVGVWLPPTSTTAGTFFPLIDGENALLVPADTPFIPLLIENHLPVAVGELTELRPGARTMAAPFRQNRGSGDIIAWVEVDLGNQQPADSEATAPEITVVKNGHEFKPLVPLARWGSEASKTLVIFRGVPSGPATLGVRGEYWRASARDIVVPDRSVAVEVEPVVLSARAALKVAWGIDAASSDSRCRVSGVPRPGIGVELVDCRGATGTEELKCESVANARRPFESAGAVTFSEVVAGIYTLRVDLPFAGVRTQTISLIPGRENRVDVSFEPYEFHGRLRVDGKPVEARLIFESGEALTDAAGHYRAALASDPSVNLVRIVTCADGSLDTYVPDEPFERNGVHDIDLDRVPVAVRVVSAATGRSVAGAKVRYSVVKEIQPQGPSFFYSSEAVPSSEGGLATFQRVPGNSRIAVCAEHDAYERACTAALLVKNIQGPVTLRLTNGRGGKVEGHEGFGIVAFVAGREVTEQVELRADGSFNSSKTHHHPEYAVYAGERRPLAVVPLPLATPDPFLVIQLPRVPARSFAVQARKMKAARGLIGIWIGDLYVPVQLLAYHQDVRQSDVFVVPDKRLTVRDIAQTGTISVAVAAPLPESGPFVDPFTLPEYISVKRTVVTADVVDVEQ